MEVNIVDMVDLRKNEWLLCPVCNNKTRTKARYDTILINFPLFCPKCKKETLVDVRKLNTTVIKEPDAKAQSHKE
jgi:Zn-finger nucleic acid-binding protein